MSMTLVLKFSQILALLLSANVLGTAMTHTAKMEQFNGAPWKGRQARVWHSHVLWWEDKLIQWFWGSI